MTWSPPAGGFIEGGIGCEQRVVMRRCARSEDDAADAERRMKRIGPALMICSRTAVQTVYRRECGRGQAFVLEHRGDLLLRYEPASR